MSENASIAKIELARLDSDGTAKPLTSLVSHPEVGWCVGPATILVDPELVDNRTGERTSLSPAEIVDDEEVVPNRQGATFSVDLTAEERSFLRAFLLLHHRNADLAGRGHITSLVFKLKANQESEPIR